MQYDEYGNLKESPNTNGELSYEEQEALEQKAQKALLAEAQEKARQAKAQREAKQAYNSRADGIWNRLSTVKGGVPDPILDADAKVVYESLTKGDAFTAEDAVKLLEAKRAIGKARENYAHGLITEKQARDAGVIF